MIIDFSSVFSLLHRIWPLYCLKTILLQKISLFYFSPLYVVLKKDPAHVYVAVCIKEGSAENTVSLSTNQKQLEFFWQAFLVIVYWYWLWLSIESKQTKKKITKRSHSTQCSKHGKIVQQYCVHQCLHDYLKSKNRHFSRKNIFTLHRHLNHYQITQSEIPGTFLRNSDEYKLLVM